MDDKSEVLVMLDDEGVFFGEGRLWFMFVVDRGEGFLGF